MNIETLKAAFQFQGNCFDGVIENLTTDCWDDSIALNAIDYPVNMGSIGNIERLLIKNWSDNQVVHGAFANGCRLMPGSWAVWTTATTYNKNDTCVNAGNVYTKSSAGAQSSSVAPTHTSGKVTGADGIEWWWLQAGAQTVACIKDITFQDCDIKTDTSCVNLMISNDGDQRSIFPGTEGNGYVDNIVFDNIKYNPPTGTSAILFAGFGFVKKVTLKNSDISPVNNCNLIYAGQAMTGVYNGYLDECIIDNCNIELTAISRALVKLNTCAGQAVTVSNSNIVMNGGELLYFYQLATERHADITLTNSSIDGAGV